MTDHDIKDRVDRIKNLYVAIGKHKQAHQEEDQLWLEVLEEIALTGDRRSATLARAALESNQISYPRGYNVG